MGRWLRRKARRRDQEDLSGPKYQFNRALAQEVLSEQKSSGAACYLCGVVAPRVAQLARQLTFEECQRYRMSRSRALIVVFLCEDCMFLPNAKERVNQAIDTALSNQEVQSFDLGDLDLPESLQGVAERLGIPKPEDDH